MLAITDGARGAVAEAEEHLRSEAGQARSEGRILDALGRGLDLAGIQTLVLEDPAVARKSLAESLAGGHLERIPAPARPYERIVHQLGMLGMVEEARGYLGDWQKDMGEAVGTSLGEARRYVEAVARPNAGPAADALERLRTEIGCPHCFEWQMAGLDQRAGRPDRAAELYEQATMVSEGLGWAGAPWFPLIRVLAQERLGQVYEALGDSAKAAEHYAKFAEAWANADADLQPRVQTAREKAAALGGAR